MRLDPTSRIIIPLLLPLIPPQARCNEGRTTNEVLTFVARLLDNVVASCDTELKEAAQEIIGHFSVFLTSVVYAKPQTSRPIRNISIGGMVPTNHPAGPQ